MDRKPLTKSILSTLYYFDIFDYPLTLLEIWQWLLTDGSNPDPVGLSQIKTELEVNPNLVEKVKFQNGFYFLAGRAEIVDIRLDRYKIAQPKFRKVLVIAKILSYFPYIKMIAVSNTLAYSNSKTEGDLDLFIITSKDRIWPTRFWALLFLTVFHLRPTVRKSQDRICTAFFIDESALDLRNLSISKKDAYFIFWLKQIFPIYGQEAYKIFFAANSWVKEFLPQADYRTSFKRRITDNWSFFKFLWEKISGLLPMYFYKNIQYWLMPSILKKMSNQDTRVVISDKILKFHKNDRRELYNRLFEENLVKNL